MNELKYLNICYDTSKHDDNFNNLICIYLNQVFNYSIQNELFDLLHNNDIHLIIINYDMELLKSIRLLNEHIQIIVFLDKLNNEHLLNSLTFQYTKFIEKINCINEFIYILKDCVRNIDSRKSNILQLKNNFIYDTYNKTLFKENKIIPLTKKEKLFLDLLIYETNKVLSYAQINKEIWSNTMSPNALRSLIKEIRKKTYKDLIKNVSGMGYRIDL